jgi:hypothetical protein
MTSTALAPIVPRLKKLLLLLSSSHDGEVVGAARAIGRALERAGSDWHEFADSISLRHDAQGRHLPPDWLDMARACRDQAHRLTPREFAFVNDMVLWRGHPTEKQFSWLSAIYRKLAA